MIKIKCPVEGCSYVAEAPTEFSEGNCLKEKCKLYPKVLRIIPKLKRLYELEAQGVIVTTLWDFSEENMKKIEKRKEKAEQKLVLLSKIRGC